MAMAQPFSFLDGPSTILARIDNKAAIFKMLKDLSNFVGMRIIIGVNKDADIIKKKSAGSVGAHKD